jgi:DNA invertase Pin-like site-specific DNA recombinase
MIIGYARVSTVDQSVDLQMDALKEEGCETVYCEKESSRKERPELLSAMRSLRAGDVLVVWKLDRMARSLKELIDLVNQVNAKGAQFRCLTQEIDTTTAAGKLTFALFAAIAEFERDLIGERTRAGLAAARARGNNGGRPSKVKKKDLAQLRRLAEAVDEKGLPLYTHRGLGKMFGGASTSTIRRTLAKMKGDKK